MSTPPRPAWRIRLGAVIGMAGELLRRMDNYVSAWLDVRTAQVRLIEFAGWLGRSWRRHHAAACRAAFGPAYGTAVVLRPRNVQINEIEEGTPRER